MEKFSIVGAAVSRYPIRYMYMYKFDVSTWALVKKINFRNERLLSVNFPE
jgi:hypothetical protein